MRLEHHLVGGYVRYISPHIIIIIMLVGKCTYLESKRVRMCFAIVTCAVPFLKPLIQ